MLRKVSDVLVREEISLVHDQKYPSPKSRCSGLKSQCFTAPMKSGIRSHHLKSTSSEDTVNY